MEFRFWKKGKRKVQILKEAIDIHLGDISTGLQRLGEVISQSAEENRADLQGLTDAVSRHIEVTTAFLRRVEDLFVPKLKYYVVFLALSPVPGAPQVHGDCIVSVKVPLETEAAVMEAKRYIQEICKLGKEPVLISWRALDD